MRRIKAIKTENGIAPDWPAGKAFPPSDENIEGVECNGEEYIIYETGDVLPESLKPRLHILRKELTDDLVVWRYMDFAKLYSLVTKSALFFTPGIMLRNQEPYELRMPVTRARAESDALAASYKLQFPGDTKGLERIMRSEQQSVDRVLYSVGISCWHINERENDALWKVFVGDREGVAIKTTIGALRQSLNCRRRSISADRVEYIDYQTEDYKNHPNASGYEQIYHKAKFFEYEREFRLAYSFGRSLQEFEIGKAFRERADPEEVDAVTRTLAAERDAFLRTGPFVPVDLNILIQGIVISPGAGSWFSELVESLINERLRDGFRVSRSVVRKWPGGQ